MISGYSLTSKPNAYHRVNSSQKHGSKKKKDWTAWPGKDATSPAWHSKRLLPNHPPPMKSICLQMQSPLSIVIGKIISAETRLVSGFNSNYCKAPILRARISFPSFRSFK